MLPAVVIFIGGSQGMIIARNAVDHLTPAAK
jgi:hypothetical protein